MRLEVVVPVAFLLCAVISAADAQGYLAGLPNEPSSTGTNRIIKTFQFPATMMVSERTVACQRSSNKPHFLIIFF
jgi:hypothetical protein